MLLFSIVYILFTIYGYSDYFTFGLEKSMHSVMKLDVETKFVMKVMYLLQVVFSLPLFSWNKWQGLNKLLYFKILISSKW